MGAPDGAEGQHASRSHRVLLAIVNATLWRRKSGTSQ